MEKRIAPPLRGVTDQAEFVNTPRGFTGPDGMLNMRNRAGAGGRKQQGPRAKIEKATEMVFGGGAPIVGLMSVGQASSLTQEYGPIINLVGGQSLGGPDNGGESFSQETLTGCAFFVTLTGARLAAMRDPDTVNYPAAAARACRIDNKYYATSTRSRKLRCGFITHVNKNYGGGIGVKQIGRLHVAQTPNNFEAPNKLAIQFTAEIEDMDAGGAVQPAARAINPLIVEFFGPFVFVGALEYVYVFAADNHLGLTPGQYIKRYNIDNWAFSVEDIIAQMVIPSGFASNWYETPANFAQVSGYVYVAYRGSKTITGPVTQNDDSEGTYYRGAVAIFRVNMTSTTDPLTHIVQEWAPDQGIEAHSDLRFSEWIATGRGRAPMAISLGYGGVPGTLEGGAVEDVDGRLASTQKLFVATTQDGFGPTGEQADGIGGYAGLFCIDDAAMRDPAKNAIKWQVTTPPNLSLLRNWQAQGFRNDIPYARNGDINPDNGFGPEPNITNVVAANGYVFVSGIFQVFDGADAVIYDRGFIAKLKATDGSMVWFQELTFKPPRRSMSIYAAAGLPTFILVGGRRNHAFGNLHSLSADEGFTVPDYTVGQVLRVDIDATLDIYQMHSTLEWIMVATDLLTI